MSHSRHCSRCKSNPCCCQSENENENKINNNPIINFNPVINIPSNPVNGGRGLLSEFDGSVLPPPIPIPHLSTTPATLGTVTLSIDDSTDRVLLQANIPWQFTQIPEADPIEVGVRFRVLRNTDEIYNAIDSIHGASPNQCGSNRITSIIFLDTTPSTGTITYTLDAMSICSFGTLTPNVTTVAPTTFTASEIDGNNSP